MATYLDKLHYYVLKQKQGLAACMMLDPLVKDGMSEEDDFDMLLEDDDKAVLELTTDLQHTGLGETVSNGVGSDKDRRAQGWTGEEKTM